MYNKIKKHILGKVFFAFFLSLSGIAVASEPPIDSDVLLDLRGAQSLKPFVINNLPTLSKITYKEFNKTIDIELIEDNTISDSGIARRIDNQGRAPNQCTISINNRSFIFNLDSYKNPFVAIGFNLENIENFIYLHELAHCNDGLVNPESVDNMEWKEALADAYAIVTMLDSKTIHTKSVVSMIKYRETNKAKGSAFILKEVLNFYNAEIKDKNLSPNEILIKVKEFRSNIFETIIM